MRIFHFIILLMVIALSSAAIVCARNDYASTSAPEDFDLTNRISGLATPPIPAPITIGGQSYMPNQLIRDFSRIAISKHSWLDDAGQDGELTPVSDSYTDLKTYPLAEYLLRNNGYPRLQAINRWEKEITIGIGWPKQEMLVAGTADATRITMPGLDPWGREYKEAYPLFQEQIEALIPTIKHITGLPVTYISPEDENDVVKLGRGVSWEHVARIRVVPTELTATRTAFPMHGNTIEKRFLAGVAFTPFEFGQVDGYILPNADNTIGFAACRINPRFDAVLVKALITECLARSLGLPNLSGLNNSAALGHWAKALDAYIDSQVKKQTKGKDNNGTAVMNVIRRLGEASTFPVTNDTQGLETGFSDYDKWMISVLYCSEIKTGMNIYQVERVLQQDNHCLIK